MVEQEVAAVEEEEVPAAEEKEAVAGSRDGFNRKCKWRVNSISIERMRRRITYARLEDH